MADPLQPGDWPLRRPEARPGEAIDRSGLIEFTFDGVKHRAHPGDTVGSALAAAGVKTLSRSFKYHRPRGLLCCAGHCPNCLVQIGGEANVRACRRPVEAGMEVRSQNAWPSLDRDLMSLAGLGAPLMPVGFYYKTFIRPARLWPLYERVLRRAAGLGSVDEEAVPGEGDKQYLHADVAVVGAGPAGIAAAAAAAREGARVLLFDENPEAGGHLRCRPGGMAAADEAVQTALAEIERAGNAVLHLDTAVVGWYQDNWLAAFRGNRLLKVRARAIVAAAGAVESPGLFAGNDLPGILLAGAAQRLLHLHGVLPGRRTVVEAGDDEGWRLAAELSEAGVEIAALVDEREAVANEFEPALRAAGAAVHLGSRIVGARGRGSVKAALIGPAAEAAGAGGLGAAAATSVETADPAADAAGAGEVEAVAAGSSEAARPTAAGVARGAAAGSAKAADPDAVRAAGGAARPAESADSPAGGTAGNASGSGPTLEVPCDSIVVRGRFAPANELLFMAGARGRFDDASGEFRLGELPAGLFNAGRCRGVEGVEAQAADGAAAGAAASSFAGASDRASSPRWQGSVSPRGTPTASAAAGPGAARSPATLPPAASGEPPPPLPSCSGKRFVCLCEDVTDEDVAAAIAEGYDSVELLKRYTTVSMGPCQGKMCALNSLEQAGRELGRAVADLGRTTSRPPVVPVTLGALAGQRMDPVQVSPLHEWHLDNGARMMVAGPWLRPEQYGDPAAEVRAVRERAGLIDVSPLGKLQLTGPGVPGLLDRLYVNQWRDLRRGRVRYGIMCNDEGVVIDDGVCARLSDREWYMSTTSAGAGNVLEWIEWWRQSGWGEGVQVADLTEANAAFNLAGPRSRELLSRLTERDLANGRFPYMRARRAEVAGVPCLLLRIGFTGELSYEIHCPAGFARHLWERLLEAGEELGIRPFGVEAQRVLRLEKGHIIVGQDTDALSDPIAADAAWAVKLEKPDFLGKRALARVAAEGPRQRLTGFVMKERNPVPEEGMQIVRSNGRGRPEIIGWVTSCRVSPTLGDTIGLCWLPAEVAAREGETFRIDCGGRLAEARVHHGAFYDPAGERLRS